jgi:thiamine-monophosphate kinase
MKNQPTLKDIGEFKLHQLIRAILPCSSKNILVGIGDDAAVIQPQSEPMVLTKDAMVEGVHFLSSNISDLAAKGAKPAFGLIALGLPGDIEITWIKDFYQMLADQTNEWGLEIIGGDTVQSPQLMISITAIGYQQSKSPIRINTAQPGDWIFVTGTVGDAAAGLEILQSKDQLKPHFDKTYLINRLLRPNPRLTEALRLLKLSPPSSMTDISDGLARDLPKICKASETGAQINANSIPCSDDLRKYTDDPISYAWKGGEDYELLFTLPENEAKKLLAVWDIESCPVTHIGSINSSTDSIHLIGREDIVNSGFDHFMQK